MREQQQLNDLQSRMVEMRLAALKGRPKLTLRDRAEGLLAYVLLTLDLFFCAFIIVTLPVWAARWWYRRSVLGKGPYD